MRTESKGSRAYRLAEGIVERPTAKLRYFDSEAGIRDRFGNRVFTSPDLAYKDREGKLGKAALFVTPEGEKFFKEHPGVLKALDVRTKVTKYFGDDHTRELLRKEPYKSVYWEHGAYSGSQSLFYQYNFDGKRYVLRTRNLYSNIIQPLHHEMLQIQAMQADLNEELVQLGIRFPTFIFASAAISFREFEEGSHPTEVYKRGMIPTGEWFDRIVAVNALIQKYIDQQQAKGNPLWKHIAPDGLNIFNGEPRTSNFVEKDDRSWVFIDPVLYRPPGLKPIDP